MATPEEILHTAKTGALKLLDANPGGAFTYFGSTMWRNEVTKAALFKAGFRDALKRAADTGNKKEFKRLLDTVEL